ncbi:2-octaprenyl-6-methoxyphenyl hydroxylase [Celerinatantimonas yamalensis]|uniref:2-octaprenyl-6-methoxyphenyl hydroxylase n=1 Tax=Celerinatantimonas yamalensis TaxID=559956 RepID=A0ABW9GAZ2_9GAMM
MDTDDFDVLICGAGMTGATLALLLSRYAKVHHKMPLRVALIEAQPLNYGKHPGFDGRAIALSAGSISVYQGCNFWSQLAPFSEFIQQIHVSDRGHFGHVDMHAKEYGLSELGAVIELSHAGEQLHQALSQLNHVTLFCPATVAKVQASTASIQVKLSDNRVITGKLLVGADGSHSQVAQQMRLNSQLLDFGQSAIIANVACPNPHQHHAYERFTPHGPVALLPMQEQRWSLVWCVPRSQQQHWLNVGDEEFLAGLQKAFGYRVGHFQRVGQRSGYPLILTQRQRVFAQRSVIIGNAAHSLHPIAGQGFNLGIRDAATLAELMVLADDPGEFALLNRYQTQRCQDIETTVGLTSALALGFASTDKLSVIPRNIGLLLMQHSASLKSKLVRQTLGYTQ